MFSGESVPAEEQYDKEKANAEVLALDNVVNNDKITSSPSMPALKFTDAEREKCEGELAKLYKQLDDKVRQTTDLKWMNEAFELVMLDLADLKFSGYFQILCEITFLFQHFPPLSFA